MAECDIVFAALPVLASGGNGLLVRVGKTTSFRVRDAALARCSCVPAAKLAVNPSLTAFAIELEMAAAEPCAASCVPATCMERSFTLSAVTLCAGAPVVEVPVVEV